MSRDREFIQAEVAQFKRSMPIELVSFPEDSAERFIAADGTVALTFADVERVVL